MKFNSQFQLMIKMYSAFIQTTGRVMDLRKHLLVIESSFLIFDYQVCSSNFSKNRLSHTGLFYIFT